MHGRKRRRVSTATDKEEDVRAEVVRTFIVGFEKVGSILAITGDTGDSAPRPIQPDTSDKNDKSSSFLVDRLRFNPVFSGVTSGTCSPR